MKHLSLSLFALLLLPSVSFAEEATTDEYGYTAKQMEQLLRPCRSEDADKFARCKARILARAKKTSKVSSPTDSFEVWDSMDLGGGHQRSRLQAERLLKYQEEVKARKTYREFVPTDDINTQRIPYLNELRERRLKCMTETRPGRSRSLCFDQLENEMRDLMEERQLEKERLRYENGQAE